MSVNKKLQYAGRDGGRGLMRQLKQLLELRRFDNEPLFFIRHLAPGDTINADYSNYGSNFL